MMEKGNDKAVVVRIFTLVSSSPESSERALMPS